MRWACAGKHRARGDAMRLEHHRMGRALLGCALAFAAAAVSAYDGAVEKKTFTLPSYTTVAGRTIKNVRVGYETYGTLNAAGDNAIFIPHFYSGTSHAAGKYDAKDVVPGYWDAIIGSGRPIDTDKYFVVSADALVNLNTKDPRVVTTGPATLDPDTGKPYGMKFPVVAYRDSVRVHKALVDSLGVKKLKAVAGASGGSMQAMEWAALYPDFVERVIHVIGPGFDVQPFIVEWVGLWAMPIRLDPKWKGGDYYGKDEPMEGVAKALELVTANTRHHAWAEKTFGYKWADPAKNPADAVDNLYAIEDTLAKAGVARAKSVDANSVIYTSKANQLYHLSDEEVKGMKAKILFVPASSDLVFPPELAKRTAERYRAQGGMAEVFVIEGDGGHLDGLLAVSKAGEAIRAFLAK